MAKRKVEMLAPGEVLDVVGEDLAVVKVDGNILGNFFEGLTTFFRTAGALEKAASDKLEIARTLKGKALTSADQDERIQRMVKGAAADIKGIEAHWEITSRVSQLHKRLVAGRQRGVAMLEEVKAIGNQLHNDYTDRERRRVAAENEAKRIQAEQEAAAARERELARAEAAALKAEASSPDLSERETMFVNFYDANHGRRDWDDAMAARVAGFKDPTAAAARLLGMAKIQKAIEAKRKAAAIRQQAEAVRAQPLDVKPIEQAKPNITRTAGGHDRTTWSGVIDDEAATIAAAFERPELGIPRDLFMINPTKLNEYARSLESRLDLWPGVHAKKKTGVV